jgi:hypothetical protein
MVMAVQTKSFGKLSEFFSKLSQVAVPEQATTAWLKSVGYASSYDATILKVLEALGFTAAKVPTSLWRDYRSGNKSTLADGIVRAFPELYKVYDKAHIQKDVDLEKILKNNSDQGIEEIQLSLRTFRALVDLAKFSETIESAQSSESVAVSVESQSTHPRTKSPSVHIDLQIHISPDLSSEKIDGLFESMAKHLYGNS